MLMLSAVVALVLGSASYFAQKDLSWMAEYTESAGEVAKKSGVFDKESRAEKEKRERDARIELARERVWRERSEGDPDQIEYHDHQDYDYQDYSE
jgi:hypothetical protein